MKKDLDRHIIISVQVSKLLYVEYICSWGRFDLVNMLL